MGNDTRVLDGPFPFFTWKKSMAHKWELQQFAFAEDTRQHDYVTSWRIPEGLTA